MQDKKLFVIQSSILKFVFINDFGQ